MAHHPQASDPGPTDPGPGPQSTPGSGKPAQSEAPLRIVEGSELHQRLDHIGSEFLADFLGVALRHRPEDVDVLGELGLVYTRLGRYSDGLEVDRRLVQLAPQNPTAHYNLACSLALCGESGAALDALEAAVSFGYDDGPHLAADEDLASLRAEVRFVSLLEKLRGT